MSISIRKKEWLLIATPVLLLGAFVLINQFKKTLDKNSSMASTTVKSSPRRQVGINDIVFSADGKQIIMGSEDGYIKQWSAFTGVLLKTIHKSQYPVGDIKTSKDGKLLAAVIKDRILVWKMPQAQLWHTFKVPAPFKYLSAVAVSPDNRFLAGAANTRGLHKGISSILLWDLETGKLRSKLDGKVASVSSIDFSHDNKFIVASCGSHVNPNPQVFTQDQVQLWDIQTSSMRWKSDSGFGSDVLFSPDGNLIAVGGVRAPDLLRASDGKPVIKLESNPVGADKLAFVPNTNLLAGSATGGSPCFWNLQTGKIIEPLTYDFADVFAFSPDGKLIAERSGTCDTSTNLCSHIVRIVETRFLQSSKTHVTSYEALIRVEINTVTGESTVK